MLLEIGDEVCDWELGQLKSVLRDVDARLEPLFAVASWNEGARDSGEYWVGVGFVACQRYITAISGCLRVPKRDSLELGPTRNGATVVGVLNAAANVWKHEEEWKEPLGWREQHTLASLEAVLDDSAWEFKSVNTLYALSQSGRFMDLIDALVEWREVLRQR